MDHTRSTVSKIPLIAVLLSLVAPDGRVSGDQFGESDTRFAYILIQSLSLLGRLSNLDALFDGNGRNAVVENILGCMNFDGAFGTEPGAESHGGQGEFGPSQWLHLQAPTRILPFEHSGRCPTRLLR